jgi:hypothetical protein
VAPPFDPSGAGAEHEEIAASVVTDGYCAIRKGAPLPRPACLADDVARGPCDRAAIAVVPDGVQLPCIAVDSDVATVVMEETSAEVVWQSPAKLALCIFDPMLGYREGHEHRM